MLVRPPLLATPKTDVMVNMPWLPFLMILLPANMMTMVMCMRVSHGRKHITERQIPFATRWVFRHWYGAGRTGQWLGSINL